MGIYDGDDESEVLDRLGKPPEQAIDEDSGTKRIRYPSYGTIFHLEKKKVYWLGIDESQ